MSAPVTWLKGYLMVSRPEGLHARWCRAAQDPDITTDFLLDLALLSIQQDGATDDGVIFGPALSVLHQRNNEEVLNAR
jgi:hypothetical protein